MQSKIQRNCSGFLGNYKTRYKGNTKDFEETTQKTTNEMLRSFKGMQTQRKC